MRARVVSCQSAKVAMANPRKRKTDEWEVSEMEESRSAMVRGVVTELSPVKVSRKNGRTHVHVRRLGAHACSKAG